MEEVHHPSCSPHWVASHWPVPPLSVPSLMPAWLTWQRGTVAPTFYLAPPNCSDRDTTSIPGGLTKLMEKGREPSGTWRQQPSQQQGFTLLVAAQSWREQCLQKAYSKWVRPFHLLLPMNKPNWLQSPSNHHQAC